MGESSCRSSFNILVMNKLFYITLFLLFNVTKPSSPNAYCDSFCTGGMAGCKSRK